MRANSLVEKLEKVSNMGGFDGSKIKADLEDARKKLIPIAGKLKEIVNKQFALHIISYILLGANVSEENECLIRDVAKKLRIPISKYRISPDRYTLEIVE